MSLWEMYKAKRLGYADDLWTSLIGKKLGGYSWISTDYEQTPYIYRAMPNLSHYYNREIMEEVVGGSVGWNQLCNGSSVTVQSGHKYFLKKGSATSIGASSGSAITDLTSGSDMVTDLTLALGSTIADYVYSLEQATAGSGVAWLKEHFPKMFGQFNAYNAGSIQSVSGLVSHITKDANDNVIGTYPLDSTVTLRGRFYLDANNKLCADGDVYKSDGTVNRKYGIRAYQSGDESLADAVTDGTNTVYKLATPTTETAQPFTKTQLCDSGGTEEWTLAGKNLAYLEQGTLRFSTDGSEEPSASRVRTNFIPIETVTMYMASSNGWVIKNGVGYDADKNYIGFGYYPSAEGGEFQNNNERVKYVRFIYGNASNTNCSPSDYWYQFEKGSTATPYEPFGFNIVSVGHKSKYAEK